MSVHENILDNMVGYADYLGCSGGAGNEVVEVTNLNDSGAGSLRDACLSGNRWIRFSEGLSGIISLQSRLTIIASNITIDGRGANIIISDHGVRLVNGAQNAAIMYLRFDHPGYPEDGLNITTNPSGAYDKVWVYRCSFIGNGQNGTDYDEALTVNCKDAGIPGPEGVTVQECYFHELNRTHLIGNSDPAYNDGDNITVTLFRNHYYHCYQRHPRMRGGIVDMANNYIEEFGSRVDTTGYGGACSAGQVGDFASLRSERNIWQARVGGSTLAMSKGPYGTDAQEGNCLSDNDLLENGATFNQANIGSVVARPYSLSTDLANQALKSSVAASAGWSLVDWPSPQTYTPSRRIKRVKYLV